jgi:hypothetical protein
MPQIERFLVEERNPEASPPARIRNEKYARTKPYEPNP